MHASGRMMLALYANGMLRLWNLLDARCNFKRMVGLSANDAEVTPDEDEEEEVTKKVNEGFEISSKYLSRPELTRWDPVNGLLYAVLFGRLLEVYSVEDDGDTPLHSASFDTQQTSFDFLSGTSLIVSDA